MWEHHVLKEHTTPYDNEPLLFRITTNEVLAVFLLDWETSYDSYKEKVKVRGCPLPAPAHLRNEGSASFVFVLKNQVCAHIIVRAIRSGYQPFAFVEGSGHTSIGKPYRSHLVEEAYNWACD